MLTQLSTHEKYMDRFIVVMFVAATATSALAQDAPIVFTPQSGFSGRSEGDGDLHLFFSHKPFHVESRGFDRADGSFQLDQAVQFTGKATENRTWVIRSAGDFKYTGTLTGVAGLVTGASSGNQLTLQYRAKGPIIIHQTLILSPDGRTIENNGRITLFGIPIGSMHELIRKRD